MKLQQLIVVAILAGVFTVGCASDSSNGSMDAAKDAASEKMGGMKDGAEDKAKEKIDGAAGEAQDKAMDMGGKAMGK